MKRKTDQNRSSLTGNIPWRMMLWTAVLFLIASINSFGQTPTPGPTSTEVYQHRLQVLTECHPYFTQTLSPANLQIVNKEMAYLQSKITSVAAATSIPTPFSQYVQSHPTEGAVRAFIRAEAVLAFPSGYSVSGSSISSLQYQLPHLREQVEKLL